MSSNHYVVRIYPLLLPPFTLVPSLHPSCLFPSLCRRSFGHQTTLSTLRALFAPVRSLFPPQRSQSLLHSSSHFPHPSLVSVSGRCSSHQQVCPSNVLWDNQSERSSFSPLLPSLVLQRRPDVLVKVCVKKKYTLFTCIKHCSGDGNDSQSGSLSSRGRTSWTAEIKISNLLKFSKIKTENLLSTGTATLSFPDVNAGGIWWREYKLQELNFLREVSEHKVRI